MSEGLRKVEKLEVAPMSLNMSNFKNEAHSSFWDHFAFVRTYVMYLDQCLELMFFNRRPFLLFLLLLLMVVVSVEVVDSMEVETILGLHRLPHRGFTRTITAARKVVGMGTKGSVWISRCR